MQCVTEFPTCSIRWPARGNALRRIEWISQFPNIRLIKGRSMLRWRSLFKMKPFSKHVRVALRGDVRAVGRVCSARVGSNPPQTPPQNYPPDWKRLATPTFPNQAGNPAFTFMSIRAFFAPDTPALRLAGCRAGVFCASETEFTPDTTAELPAGLGTPRYSQRFQTRRVIRRSPS
jgi:hypothetical protein